MVEICESKTVIIKPKKNRDTNNGADDQGGWVYGPTHSTGGRKNFKARVRVSRWMLPFFQSQSVESDIQVPS